MDGDNLFAWLPAMAAARQAGDAAGFARALRRAADAGLYDSRMGTSFLRLRPVLATLPVPPSCDDDPGWKAWATRAARPADASLLADMEAGAVEHAIAMPALQALGGCRLRELWRMWAEAEVNVLRREAIRAGRWPPPDDWLPDDARGRTSITGEPARD